MHRDRLVDSGTMRHDALALDRVRIEKSDGSRASGYSTMR